MFIRPTLQAAVWCQLNVWLVVALVANDNDASGREDLSVQLHAPITSASLQQPTDSRCLSQFQQFRQVRNQLNISQAER